MPLAITGYASTKIKDRQGDIILPSAWRKSGTLDAYKRNPVLLNQHDATQPIGTVNKLFIDDFGLMIEATLGDSEFLKQHILPMIQQKVLKAFSVGFIMTDTPKWDAVLRASIIDSVHLLEISIVSIPSNDSTLFDLDDKETRASRGFLTTQNGNSFVFDKKGWFADRHL